MRADYESQFDTLQIDLIEIDHLDGAKEVFPLAVVSFADGRPAGIDLRGVSDGIEKPLTAVAEMYGLDAHELIAAGRAAIETPDRTVTLEFAKAA